MRETKAKKARNTKGEQTKHCGQKQRRKACAKSVTNTKYRNTALRAILRFDVHMLCPGQGERERRKEGDASVGRELSSFQLQAQKTFPH